MAINEITSNDVVIVVDEDEFPCQRNKLKRESPYFQAMFSGHFDEKNKDRIEIKNVKPTAFKFILNWIKDSDQIESLKEEDILDVLQGAAMLQFSLLQQKCEEMMVQRWLSADSCLLTATKADQLSLNKLHQKAFSLALWNFCEVRNTRAFKELTPAELEHYLKQDALFLGPSDDEFLVFEAVSCWLDHNKFERISATMEALSCVRMSHISLSDLQSMLNYTCVEDCEDAQLLIKCLLVMREGIEISVEEESITDEEEFPDVAIEGDNGCCDNLKKRLADTLKSEADDSISNLEISYSKKSIKCKPAIFEKAQSIVSAEKRSLPAVACIIGHYTKGTNTYPEIEENDPSSDSVKKTKKEKRDVSGSPYIFIWNGMKEKPVPFLPLTKINEGPTEAVGYTVVSKGQDVYVIGGEYLLGYGNWNKSVWKYNVWSETWTFETSLGVPRRHHSVVCLDDDLYVIGGCGKFRVIMNSVDRYNFKTRTWHRCMPLPMSLYSAATCVHNNLIYVISCQVFCYYPRSNRWETVSDVNIPSGLSFNTAMPYEEHIFLTSRYSADLMCYDPSGENSIRQIGTFQHLAGDACLVGSKIYSFTEDNEVACVEMYDIEENSFKVLWIGDPKDKEISFKKLGGCFPLILYETLWQYPKIEVE